MSGQLLAASTAYVVPAAEAGRDRGRSATSTDGAGVDLAVEWAAVLLLPLLIGLGMVGESLPLRRRLARMGA